MALSGNYQGLEFVYFLIIEGHSAKTLIGSGGNETPQNVVYCLNQTDI